MRIYLASPFFSEKEISAVKRAEQILEEKGLEIFSPRLHEVRGAESGTPVWSRQTFLMDQEAIDESDIVVMLYWGGYSDSGTAWECGYAFAKGKKVIVVHLGKNSNLMIHEGSHSNLQGLEELETYNFATMETKEYRGEMF